MDFRCPHEVRTSNRCWMCGSLQFIFATIQIQIITSSVQQNIPDPSFHLYISMRSIYLDACVP